MENLLADIIVDLTPIINTAILTILGGIATWIGVKGKAFMDSMERSQKLKDIKEGLEINKEIVETSVDYAEKIGSHLAGTEKFKLAKEKAYSIMAEWGIEISDAEVEALIEQVVLGYQGEKEKNEKPVNIELNAEKIETNEGGIENE